MIDVQLASLTLKRPGAKEEQRLEDGMVQGVKHGSGKREVRQRAVTRLHCEQ